MSLLLWLAALLPVPFALWFVHRFAIVRDGQARGGQPGKGVL